MKKILCISLLASNLFTADIHAARRAFDIPIVENIILDTTVLEEFVDTNTLKKLDHNSKEAILHVSAILSGILGAIAHKDNERQPELFAESVHTAVEGITSIILIGAQQNKKSEQTQKNAVHLAKKIERIIRNMIKETIKKSAGNKK